MHTASLNHVYRLVWDRVRRLWIPVAETSRSRGKSGRSGKVGGVAAISALVGIFGAAVGNTAWALPTGGQVSSGSGQIAQTSTQLTVNQQSQNLAINWQSFNIGASESVSFNQPNSSAIALNRVLGQDPSTILGHLSANGQVFLLNPNGVLFGQSAQVNVGSLLASTLSLSDADFVKGNFNLTGSSTAAISNSGTINAAQGGYVALLGASVTNSGNITAPQGNVSLAAGQDITLQLDNGSLLGLTVNQGAVNALAQNHGLIEANGGQILLTAEAADDLTKAVVNNDGILEAQTINNQAGKISLISDLNNGMTNVSGTLDASAPNGGNGGSIETSGAVLNIAADAVVTAAAKNGQAGTWLLDPYDITIGTGTDTSTSSGTNPVTYNGTTSGSLLLASTLTSVLNSGTSVVVDTAGAGSDEGNITVATGLNVAPTSAASLTLRADGDININNNIISTGSPLSLNLTANGVVNNNAFISTNNGNVTINAGSSVNLGGLNVFGGTLEVTAGGAITQSGELEALAGTNLTVTNAADNIILTNASNDIAGNLVLNASGGGSIGTLSLTDYAPVSLVFNTTPTNLTVNDGSSFVLPALQLNGNLDVTATKGITLDGGITTGGTQTYRSPVTLNSDITLASSGTGSNGAIDLASTVDGAHGLTVSTAGLATFGGNVGSTTALSSLTTNGSDPLLSGNITTTGNQTYTDAVTLGNNVTLTSTAGNVTFVGTIDNAASSAPESLTIDAAHGAATFVAPVGSLNGALSGLTTDSQTLSLGGASNSNFLNIGSLGLSLTTTAGNINQGGGFTVAGPSSFNASNGTNTVNLTNSNNFLTGSVTATGNGIGITDALTLNIATLQDASNGEVRLISGGSLNLAPATIDTGSAELILEANGGTLSTTANLTGAIIDLAGSAGLTINNTLNATNGLSLSSNAGAITEGTNGVINTPTLTSNSAGATTLNNTGNQIASLAGASATDLSLIDNSSLTVGTIASTSTKIQTTLGSSSTLNSLTLNGVINASGTGDAIVLATQGTFTNNAGSNALNASNGNWQVWSANPPVVEPVIDFGLTADFIQYGAQYGTTAVQGTGNGLLYSATPIVSADLVGSITKVYDGTTSATLSPSNFFEYGEEYRDTVTLSYPTTGTYATANVNDPKAFPAILVTTTGLGIVSSTHLNYAGDSVPVYGYQVSQPTGGFIGNITPAPLTISGLTGTDRAYNGSTADALTGTAVLNGLVGGQNLTLIGGTVGTLASANAGSEALTVNMTLANGTGTNAGLASNYSLSAQPTLPNVNISPVTLTVTGLTGTDQTYNGSTLDTLSGTAVLHGLVGNETLVVNNTTTGTLSSANAGSEAVTTNLTLSNGTNGGLDGNYVLIQPTLANVTINPVQLLVTGLSGTNRTYDGTTVDALTGTPTLFNLVNGETLTMSNTNVGTLSSANAGNESVTSAVTLGNGTGLASNYILTQATSSVVISPAPLTISGLSGTDRAYDGTTVDNLTGTATLNGLVNGETLTLGNTSTGILSSPNAGSEGVTTAVTIANGTGLTSNYTLTQATLPNVNISPAVLTVTGLTGTDRAYNGSTLDVLSGTGTLSGLVNGETLVLNNTTTGTLASANAGSEAITTNFTLSNGTGLASNYVITQPTLPNVNITPALLVVTGLSGTNRTYDGTTVDALTGTPTLFGLVNGETLTLSNANVGTLSSANAGSEGVTTAIALGNGTGLASNYSLIQTSLANVTISPAPLTITAGNATKTYGQVNPLGDYTVSGLVNNETVGDVSLTSPGASATASVLGSPYTITASNATGGTFLASNYAITYVDGKLTVTPAALTITADDATKTYGQTATLTGFSATGLQNGETVGSVTETSSGAAANATVNGSPYSITASNATGGTFTASNYTIAYVDGNLTVLPSTTVVNPIALTSGHQNMQSCGPSGIAVPAGSALNSQQTSVLACSPDAAAALPITTSGLLSVQGGGISLPAGVE